MRQLSDDEKKWVKTLVEDSLRSTTGYLPINLFEPVLQGSGNNIGIDCVNNILHFYVLHGVPTMVVNANHSVTTQVTSPELLSEESRIISRALLLDMLQKEGLIYFLNNGNYVNPTGSIYVNPTQGPYITVPLDSNISSIIKMCINNTLICMPELIEYVKNGFLTPEEKRHLIELAQREKETEESSKIARRNLIAAYVVGFCSPIIAGAIGYYTAGHVTTTVETVEFQHNIEALDKAIDQIDSLSSSCNKPGTLTVDGITEMNKELTGIKGELSNIKRELKQMKDSSK